MAEQHKLHAPGKYGEYDTIQTADHPLPDPNVRQPGQSNGDLMKALLERKMRERGQPTSKGEDQYLPLQPKKGSKYVTEKSIDPRLLKTKPGTPERESEVNSVFERDQRGGKRFFEK